MTTLPKIQPDREQASTTVAALLMLFVLSLVGANVLLNSTSRYNGTMKTAGWQEAMQAAEAGADIGLANIRWTVTGGTANTPFDPAAGWIATSGTYSMTTGTMQQAGQGPSATWAKITVDSPAALKDQKGTQWYRIRSSGYSIVPGFSRVSIDTPTDMNARHDKALRKFSLRIDRFTGSVVTVPQALRRIETIAQPRTAWSSGVIANVSYNWPYIDSYDSSNPNKSTGGLYDPAKLQSKADVIINSNTPPKGTIKGTASINDNSNKSGWGSNGNASNVSGQVRNDVYVYTPPVLAPTWTVMTVLNDGQYIRAGTTSSPLNYKFDLLSKGLTVDVPSGSPTGAVNIWVVGDITAPIIIKPGVTAKIWFAGNINMKASDLDNQNNTAATLQFYGINPPTGTTQSINMQSGSPGYHYATWYAPAADFTSNGNPDFCGAFVFRTIGGNGNNTLHFDEALIGAGNVIDYRRASFVEDER